LKNKVFIITIVIDNIQMQTYIPLLSLTETQQAIIDTKNIFQKELGEKLNLIRTSAPKFLKSWTGLQDDLAGTCESIKFFVPSCGYQVEIVHSLAKWKRNSLKKYNIPVEHGIYTDMDAIRKDEVIDDIHSIYVDQYDWELHIRQADRNRLFLEEIVKKIIQCISNTEDILITKYPKLHKKVRVEDLFFITSENLLQMFPKLTPKEREKEITKLHKVVFLIGIGGQLSDGSIHDIRAHDYDDFSSGLNGDILVWDDVRKDCLELSSMGIRVDRDSLIRQAEFMHAKIDTQYHHDILENKLPFSIGGGIGQSRLCMFLLEKRHIGEVQVSEWSNAIIEQCKMDGIPLL